jgi:hypothetical protein
VPKDGDGKKVGFRYLFCLDAVGDLVYVGDRDLQRIAKFRMGYREMKKTKVK